MAGGDVTAVLALAVVEDDVSSSSSDNRSATCSRRGAFNMALISDLGLIDALVTDDVREVCLGMEDDDGVFGVASTRDLLSASMAAVGIDAEENGLGVSPIFR